MAALARQDISIFPFSSPQIFCLEEKNVDGAAGRNRPFPEEKKMANSNNVNVGRIISYFLLASDAM